MPYGITGLERVNSVEYIEPVVTFETRNGASNSVNKLICLCVTGQPDVSKDTSSRILMLTSYITSMVLMAAYSAFLISSLAVEHHDLPFRDLQGLLHDGSYKLGVLRNGSNFNMFNVCGRKYFWPDYLVGVSFWVKGQAGKGRKNSVSNVFCWEIMSNLTDILSLFSSIETIFKDAMSYVAVFRSFPQQRHHTNCRHVQWH